MKRGMGRCSGGISECGGCGLGRHDIERDACTHLQACQLCETRDHVEVPAEFAGAAWSGSNPHVEGWQSAERRLQTPERFVEQLRAQRTLVLEPRARAPR